MRRHLLTAMMLTSTLQAAELTIVPNLPVDRWRAEAGYCHLYGG
jgi:hypothetical protein